MRFPIVFVAILLLAAPLPTIACSVVPGYRMPTNVELVADADLILLATVTDGERASDATPEQRITVEPLAAIKGDLPPAPLAMPGWIATGNEAMLSNPYDLKDAHPQSLAGACNRMTFPRGSRVLFFLKWEGDHWRAAGGPFSRWAEDVLTDDAPWLQVVRLYAEAAALPASDRTAYLTARRDEHAAERDNPVAQLIAADIARQLAGPNAPLREELPSAPDEAPDSTDRG
ncbi:MAG: hypothetical protein ACK4GG_10690 [Sphingomonas sp.]